MRLANSARPALKTRLATNVPRLRSWQLLPPKLDPQEIKLAVSRNWRHYALAILLTFGAVLLNLVIYDVRERTPLLFCFGAVLLAGWFGGLWPALLATGLSTLFALLRVTPLPLTSAHDLIPLAGFVATNLLSAWLSEMRLRSDAAQKFLLEREREARSAAAQRASEVDILNLELEKRVRKRTAALSSTVKELEAFSYSVSHDLRAPLRSLDGLSQALLEDYEHVLDEEGQQYLKRIRANSQKMSALIDALLQLSRVTRKEISDEDVDLSVLANEIVQEFCARDGERKVTTNVKPGMRAQGDPSLLRIALANIIGNAWKFTKNSPDAHVDIGNLDEDGHSIYFVRDNGVGFEMKYARKLFTAFERLHHEYEFEGTGIGLATVQRIIHKHGGRIWGESEVGKGASFYFTLNEKEAHEPGTDDFAGRRQS